MIANYIPFLHGTPDSSLIYQGNYNALLVTISVLIAILGSYAMLSMVPRVEFAPNTRQKILWIATGAVAMGCSIWAMHFIGMLALRLPCGVYYDPVITLLSMIPGMLASGVALTFIGGHDTSLWRRISASALLGMGIGTMHYTGMAAMKIEGIIRYDPNLFYLSIIVAVLLAFAALQTRSFLKLQTKWGVPASSIIMGCATSGMHYTAMAAAYFIRGDTASIPSSAVNPHLLVFLITAVTSLMALLAIAVNAAFRNLYISHQLRTLSVAIEQSPTTVIITDLKGSIQYVNPNFAIATGYTAAEAIGKNPRMLKSGLTPQTTYADLWETITSGEVWKGELINRRKNGETYWEEAHIAPVKNPSGAITHYVAVKFDLSEHKHIEAQLKESEEKFRLASLYSRSLFEASLDPLVTVSPDGKITDVNQAAMEATKVIRDEMIGSDFCNYFTDPEKARAAYQQVLSDGYITDYPLAIRSSDGRIIDVLYNANIYRNAAGAVAGIFAAARDITERKASESFQAFLKEGAETKFKVAEILQHADIPLATRFDDALAIIFEMKGLDVLRQGGVFLADQNSQALNLFVCKGNLTPEFIRDEQVVPFGRCLCGRAALAGEIIVSDNCFEDQRHENRWPDMELHGHYIIPLMLGRDCQGVLFLYTSATPDRNPGRLEMLEQIGGLFALAIANDKANQATIKAKENAEALATYKSEFLANMSHEIRTPMNAIIGLSQLALNKEVPDDVRDDLEKINQSSESLLGILNDILDFSKIEAGKLSIENRPFRLSDMLDNLRNLFSFRAEQKHLGFHITIASDVPNDLTGDALRIRQVLSNLIGNAIKFTSHGEIRLTVARLATTQEHARIRFCVSDTGIGISPENQAGLFQPFMQADSSITRRFGGTGLGLAISHGLVQRMNGELQVVSVPGSGSTFSVEIELGISPGELQVERSTKSQRQAGSLGESLRERGKVLRNVHILVAEDNLINQQVVKKLLSLANISVDIASNGKEVLQLLDNNTYDAILMDVHMPEMGGVEATEQIRRQPRFALLPIIALTAGVTDEEKASCLSCGMNDFLAKPIQPDALIEALIRWVRKD